MGEVIRLEDRRARRRPETTMGEAVRAEFLFDLASPFTYLAAERVDRAFDEVTWTPACARTLRCASMPADFGDVQEIVNHGGGARRGAAPAAGVARALADGRCRPRCASRTTRPSRAAAGRSCSRRRGSRSRAASTSTTWRSSPRPAAAAGLRLDGCLKAAREERRDGAMEAASRRLLGAGADRLPALCG